MYSTVICLRIIGKSLSLYHTNPICTVSVYWCTCCVTLYMPIYVYCLLHGWISIDNLFHPPGTILPIEQDIQTPTIDVYGHHGLQYCIAMKK